MKLLIDPSDGAPFERTLNSDSLIVGRASTCDLLIPDPFLSRHHARIFRDNGELYVEDLDSRNGTEVNGVTIDGPTKLQRGDYIKVSGSRIDLDHRAPRLSTADLQATVLRPAIEFLKGSELDTQDGAVDAKSLRSYAERLHRLNDVYKLIGSTLSLKDLERVLLTTVLNELKPEHVAIFLLQEDGSYAQTATMSAPGSEGAPPPYSERLVDEVCHKGMSALINDVAHDERFSGSQSLILAGPQSLAAAPLLNEHGSLGMVVASTASTTREFLEEDLELLTSIASVAALKIRNLRLAQAAIARQRHQQELVIARRIQESLLPQTLPHFPKLELFARNTPSRGVSGDFFQITKRGEHGECLVLIVDVSGKGVPASLLTASIEALAVGPIEDNKSPAQIFDSVSRRLYERSPPEKYATAFLATIDPDIGRLEYANAGHNPPLIVRADGTQQRLDLAGRPLGLVEGSEYQLGAARLEPGDTLVAYTDGLTEAENQDGEQYGSDQLANSALRHLGSPIEEFGEALLEDIDAFTGDIPPTDDCTVVLVRRPV